MATKVSDRRFAESKHRYTDPRTKERVTGVTSIVGCFDSGDKLGAGAYAAVKLMKEGKFFRDEWDAKRDLGTRVHGYAERFMTGRMAEVRESDGGHVDAFVNFCNDVRPEWIEVERPVIGKAVGLGYGGRFDMIGSWVLPEPVGGFDAGDSPFILADIKTGKSYPVELSMQLAAYRFADGLIVYDDDGWAVDLDPMPHVDLCAGLYLHDDGTYDLTYVEADKDAFLAFSMLLSVKTWAAASAKSYKNQSTNQTGDAA